MRSEHVLRTRYVNMKLAMFAPLEGRLEKSHPVIASQSCSGDVMILSREVVQPHNTQPPHRNYRGWGGREASDSSSSSRPRCNNSETLITKIPGGSMELQQWNLTFFSEAAHKGYNPMIRKRNCECERKENRGKYISAIGEKRFHVRSVGNSTGVRGS